MEPYRCNDTGKVGIYFSDTEWIPIGMVLEYNKPLRLLKYKTNVPIVLYRGKYTFRYLEPNLFFESNEDMREGNFRLNTDPEESQYWNHIDYGAFPKHEIFDHDFWRTSQDSEIFITDMNEIQFVEDMGIIDPETALKTLNDHIQN